MKQQTDKKLNSGMFSSKTDLWSTPMDFFNKLNEKYRFTLDPCANEENHKCDKYYTLKDDGLSQSWAGERVFCNPPYGSAIPHWVKKCHDENKNNGTFIVLLIPSRTDTRYFHDYIYHQYEIEFIKGRLKFGNSKGSAPFPSMIVIFK